MRTSKGPALFLAQFASDEAPFDRLGAIARWARDRGFEGVQIPTWDRRLFDLEPAATSETYGDEVKSTLADAGLQLTELSTHLQGQLVAARPAYDALLDGFAPPEVHGDPAAGRLWAAEQLRLAALASGRLGLDAHATFSGALAWPFLYPLPQRPSGLVDEAFGELARRWRPILDRFDDAGCDVCFELHPSEDLHDGVTFERFLAEVDDHPRCNILYDPSHMVLQCMDYLGFIDHCHQRIRMFHVKDAEYTPSARVGVYGGYLPWVERPGRFRSLGDGHVDFRAVFSKLAQHDFAGWAVLEWECALKDGEVGAREGASFIRDHIIPVTARPFDDFAGACTDRAANRRLLGLGERCRETPSSARHGRRRRRELHRRGAPDRIAPRRPMDGGRRRPVGRPRAGRRVR